VRGVRDVSGMLIECGMDCRRRDFNRRNERAGCEDISRQEDNQQLES
jgi:hypothetical protein